MAEIDIKMKGIWKYRYRAVDELGQVVNFLRQSAARQLPGAFLIRPRESNNALKKITMAKPASHQRAITRKAEGRDSHA